MMLAINLGTETVRGTRRQADRNMRALCRAAGVPPRFRREGPIERGRYGYLLTIGDRSVSVDMPGCALDDVRSRSPFAPRAYIDGSSWRWRFALEVLREALAPD